MVNMPAAVEVDERQQRDLRRRRVGRRGQLFRRGVVGGHVCVVVFRVVQFHDFARDGGLERGVVICR